MGRRMWRRSHWGHHRGGCCCCLPFFLLMLAPFAALIGLAVLAL